MSRYGHLRSVEMSIRHWILILLLGCSFSFAACTRKPTEVTGDMEKAKKEKFPAPPGKGGGPAQPGR